MAGAKILAFGGYQPDQVVTNDDLALRVDTSDEWIRSRVGIESRRIADKDTLLVDMAADAGARAIKDSGLEMAEIGAVIVATCTMVDNIPNAAAQVAHQLGIAAPAAFDLNTACSGFAYGLAVAADLVRGGTVRHVLVIGAEKLSDWVDWTDRRSAILFADGAGAAVVGSGKPGEPSGIGPVVWGSDGARADLIDVPAGGKLRLRKGLADNRIDGLVPQDLGGAVALLAHEHGDRHAPGALARDHPVGAGFDHAVDAVLARGRHPLRHRDRLQRTGAQRVTRPGLAVARNVLVHRDEPLRRVAEDHRLLRAPGMRILVLEPAAREQHAGIGQRVDNGLVGVALLALVGEHPLANKPRSMIGESAVGVDRIGDCYVDIRCLQQFFVLHPNIEVFAAVTGRRMDETCAGFISHVIAFEQWHQKLVPAPQRSQRM